MRDSLCILPFFPYLILPEFMSDSSNDSSNSPEEKKDSQIPEGAKSPPPPDPDLLDTSTLGPTYSKNQDGKRSGTGRNHPTDPYDPIKKKTGCGGFCGCLAGLGIILGAVLITLLVVISCFGPGKYAVAGYKVVILGKAESTITVPPEEAIWYIGQDIIYSVPETRFPVAISAAEITIGGEFYQDVSLTAKQVNGKSTARFNRDLEVFANRFTDEGITLRGELTGRVIEP
tara:strand:- start:36442 stop:37131 length:690 start_codon:yes stop_codon:yes gene_type:complete